MSKVNGKMRDVTVINNNWATGKLKLKDYFSILFMYELDLVMPDLIRKYTDHDILLIKNMASALNYKSGIKNILLVNDYDVYLQLMHDSKVVERPKMQTVLDDKEVYGSLTNQRKGVDKYDLFRKVAVPFFGLGKIHQMNNTIDQAVAKQMMTLHKAKKDAVPFIHNILAELVPTILLGIPNPPKEYLDATVKLLEYLELEVLTANEENLHPLAKAKLRFLRSRKNFVKDNESTKKLIKAFFEEIYDQYLNEGRDFGILSAIFNVLHTKILSVEPNISAKKLKQQVIEESFAQLLGLEFAGIATTSTALQATLAHLGLNPDVLKQSKAEVSKLNPNFLQTASYQELFSAVPTLVASFIEALRIDPSQAPLLRQTYADTYVTIKNFDGTEKKVFVPKDTFILICLKGINTSIKFVETALSKIYKIDNPMSEEEKANYDTHKFNPDFWQLGTGKTPSDNWKLVTNALSLISSFGTDVHVCIGKNLAIYESVRVLVSLLMHYPDLIIEVKEPNFIEYGLSTSVKKNTVFLRVPKK